MAGRFQRPRALTPRERTVPRAVIKTLAVGEAT